MLRAHNVSFPIEQVKQQTLDSLMKSTEIKNEKNK